MHRTLGPLLQLPHLLNRRIGFVSAFARNRYQWIPFRLVRQIVSAQMKHLGMALLAWRDRESEMFLVFEHKADYSLPLYAVFLLKRRPVFFFVHDMQQVATLTVRCRLALKMCRYWVRCGEFYPLFISLDDSSLDSGSRFPPEKELTIPHPHPLADSPPPSRPPRTPGTPFRVGIIGTPRKEKPIRELLEILRDAQQRLHFQLVVGLPLLKRPEWLNDFDVEILDTGTDAQYTHCLSSLDIFVVDFVQSEYNFRPSGAIVDAGMNGCYIICPDYPVFREQIGRPVSIGATFRNLDQIPALLDHAMRRLETKPIDSDTWRAHHRIGAIAKSFQAFLQKRGDLT